MYSLRNLTKTLLCCLGALSINHAVAGPADYVYTPTVEEGEREIDFKYGTAKEADGTRSQQGTIGFGYGVNSFWFTEIYFKHEREGDERLSLAEWENKFQLTETGKYFVDVGLITEIEAPLNNNDAPWELKVGPLFQKEIGKVQLNGNILFEHKYGGEDNEDVTELGYQWQAKYRLMPEFEFGMQGMGEVGEWDHWENHNEQNHRMGPAVFGKFKLSNNYKIAYNAAWLLGVSDAAPDNTLRMQVEFEF